MRDPLVEMVIVCMVVVCYGDYTLRKIDMTKFDRFFSKSFIFTGHLGMFLCFLYLIKLIIFGE